MGAVPVLVAVALFVATQCSAVVLDSAAALDAVTLEQLQVDPRAAFNAWVKLHARSYANDAQELEARYSVWTANMQHVLQHSLKQSSMQLGMNKFADMTEDEFRAAYLGYNSQRNPLLAAKAPPIEEYRYRHIQAPAAVDWRTSGMVGPVKDQHVGGAPCGCCWAFATIGMTECINAIYTGGEMTVLSEQQLIDCDHAKPFEDIGCEGGDFTGGMHYIITNGGIDTEADYPYVAQDDKCSTKKEGRKVVTLDAWEAVPPGNETALMQAVSQHPVAVGMCCGDFLADWHAYKGGIFDSPCCEMPIDHAVLVVGYGSEGGQDYWIVKNSWGTAYGEDGFIRFKRGLGGFGQCSIAHEPAYAIKTSPNPVPLSSLALAGRKGGPQLEASAAF